MTKERENNILTTRLLKDGDEKTFRTVFDDYYALLLSFAFEYVRDNEVGKNLVQEAFMKLWENRKNLKEDTNIKAFLYRITRNNCLNYLNREKVKSKIRKQLTYRNNELLLNYEALEQLDFNTVTFKELYDIIENTINQLPPQCRKIFLLSRQGDLKNREIAAQLNISPKTVEGHISKALKEIRIQLKKNYPSEFLAILIAIL